MSLASTRFEVNGWHFLLEIQKVLVCPGVKDVKCFPLCLKETENKIQNWVISTKGLLNCTAQSSTISVMCGVKQLDGNDNFESTPDLQSSW